MSDQPTAKSLIEELRSRGDPGRTSSWRQCTPDYVSEYSLRSEHVPALVRLATEWVDASSDSAEVYGPVHAWRALGQMRAIEAVQPLLSAQDRLDELGDDWYLEEFHHVYGLIGPPAIESLESHLADDSHTEFSLVSAANGLCEVARLFPETRDSVTTILTEQLRRHRQDARALNGLLVGYLLDLEATESAEVIERAFAANVVDPKVVGDWGDVRHDLGVQGLGIAPDHAPGWQSPYEGVDLEYRVAEKRRRAAERKKRKAALRQAKARSKQKSKEGIRTRKPR